MDSKPATAARIYDYFIGGTHNFPADRAAAEAAIATAPTIPAIARANRAFLRRAVRHVTTAGIRQFLDIGSGIPTEGNVHEIAQDIAEDSRIVYVDIDPVAVAEGLEILDGNDRASAIRGDLRDPAAILGHPDVRRLIDFDRPVAILLCAVLHFLPDDAEVGKALALLTATAAGGSYLVFSHGAPEVRREENEQAVTEVYARRTTSSLRLRTAAEVAALVVPWELVEPGLVWTPQWRPDPGDPTDFSASPSAASIVCGVGRLH